MGVPIAGADVHFSYRMGNDPLSSRPAERWEVLRIVDANFNRASEGLRVVEEYYRFAADDALLARACKDLRHELAQLMRTIPDGDLARARQTELDVGTSISTEAERCRQSLADVVAANWKRVEQALRAIEEYGKLASPLDARQVEQLRYRAYTIGKAISIERSSSIRLREASLYVLIDGGPPDSFDAGPFCDRVCSLVSAGVPVLQLREKRLDDAALLARAAIVRGVTRDTGTIFIMNDRADLAIAAGADGVHLGQKDLEVHAARRIVGTQMLIGVSTHTIEQARRAVLAGADYIGCGPTFPSSTKEFAQFAGLELLRQVAREITLPSFAIGGIHAENLPQVQETGMRRVAVSGAIWKSADPGEAARHLLAATSRQ